LYILPFIYYLFSYLGTAYFMVLELSWTCRDTIPASALKQENITICQDSQCHDPDLNHTPPTYML